MLRIEKDSTGCVARLLLSGRIQSDRIDCIRSVMDDGCKSKMLDLSDVTLVDVEVIHFLIRCEDQGIELAHCPPYIREWIARERVEGAQRQPSHKGLEE